MEESLRTLILQAVDELFVEALMEECIGYEAELPMKWSTPGQKSAKLQTNPS